MFECCLVDLMEWVGCWNQREMSHSAGKRQTKLKQKSFFLIVFVDSDRLESMRNESFNGSKANNELLLLTCILSECFFMAMKHSTPIFDWFFWILLLMNKLGNNGKMMIQPEQHKNQQFYRVWLLVECVLVELLVGMNSKWIIILGRSMTKCWKKQTTTHLVRHFIDLMVD